MKPPLIPETPNKTETNNNLKFSTEELELVRKALGAYGTSGIGRSQGKVDQMREKVWNGTFDSTLLLSFIKSDADDINHVWSLSEKVLSANEKTRLKNFIDDYLRTPEWWNKDIKMPFEKFQHVLTLLRERFEAILKGETTPEMDPEEDYQAYLKEQAEIKNEKGESEVSEEELRARIQRAKNGIEKTNIAIAKINEQLANLKNENGNEDEIKSLQTALELELRKLDIYQKFLK